MSIKCPIHLEKIILEEAAALPCGHVFCMPCITTCFNNLDFPGAKLCPCPTCRKPTTFKKVLPLFLNTSSPSSSPAKCQAGQLPASEKTKARKLRQKLQSMDADADAEEVEDACADMDRIADGVADTSRDIEAKCLAQEITAAATRFQSLILPELKELGQLRDTVSRLQDEIKGLRLHGQQKDKEIDGHQRARTMLEKDLANLRMSKRISDDKCSGLRENLTVTAEKLVDAEVTNRAREEANREKDEQLAKYKKWLATHKASVTTLQTKVTELEKCAEELNKQLRHSARSDQDRSRAGGSGGSMGLVPGELYDAEDDFEPPPKRRRTELVNIKDIKLDRSCFVKVPQPSFKISAKNVSEPRTTRPALNVTKAGQVKGVVALGSRQRLGRLG